LLILIKAYGRFLSNSFSIKMIANIIKYYSAIALALSFEDNSAFYFKFGTYYIQFEKKNSNYCI